MLARDVGRRRGRIDDRSQRAIGAGQDLLDVTAADQARARDGDSRFGHAALLYLCLNTGFCLSMKACMPIFWSSVANSEWNIRRSNSMPSASVPS